MLQYSTEATVPYEKSIKYKDFYHIIEASKLKVNLQCNGFEN